MKPMLAAKCEDVRALVYPVLASAKLDGVRALIRPDGVRSRSLKLIPNSHVQWLFNRAEYVGLDGELIVGPPDAKDAYRRTVSAVMSEEGFPEATFYVFDQFLEPATPFEVRMHRTEQIVRSARNIRVKYLTHELIENETALLAYEARMLEQGFEGVMIRSRTGPYKHGRATAKEGSLLKLKRFEDGEARITGFVPKFHNANEATRDELGRTKRSSAKAGLVRLETLGALSVADVVTGVEFEIGTGFDEALRTELWKNRHSYAGKLVKYKFFPGGVKDKPRFPVFLGFRDRIDL